jgi:hypothetical protein
MKNPLIRCHAALRQIAAAFVILTSPALQAAPPDLTAGGVPDTTRTINLGPTGARGWVYHVNANGLRADTSESRQIQVQIVDTGSPAAGILAPNDVILGADGTGANPVAFTSDARRALADAIDDAEAHNPATLSLLVWRAGVTSTMTITLQSMGSYSATAPYNCPKSALILEQGLQYVMASETSGYAGFGAMSLLAGNNPANPNNAARMARVESEVLAMLPDEATVTALMSDTRDDSNMQTWNRAHTLILLCEYHLLTGDTRVLPAIQAYAVNFAKNQSLFGTIGHKYSIKNIDGSNNGPIIGYGPVNSAGMPYFLGLLLAKQCGITHAEIDPAIERSNRFYAYYAHKGVVPYGENKAAIGGHENNGKSALGALCFGLQPSRADEAKYYTRLALASASEREHGHTGAFFNYLWAPLGAAAGGEEAAAAHFSRMHWMLDLNRKWNGAFDYDCLFGEGPDSGEQYNNFRMSTAALLTYALPLRQLYVTGKTQNPALLLTTAEVAASVAADDYNPATRTIAELVDDLGNWSPIVQNAAGEEIANRTLDAGTINQIIGLATDPQGTSREGACYALGKINDSASAANRAATLAGLLTNPKNHLRAMAATGLREMPQSDRLPHLNTMLAALASLDQPLLPLVEEDPLHFSHACLVELLFASSTPSGVIAGSGINGVDRNLLYPAIRAAARHPVGAVRDNLAATYPNLTQQDVEALADTLVDSIHYRALGGAMYGWELRSAGLTVLRTKGYSEGIPLGVTVMEEEQKEALVLDILDNLESYAGSCKLVVPDPHVLERLETLGATTLIGSDAQMSAALQQTIDAIIADTNPNPTTPLKTIHWVVSDAAELTFPTNQTTLHVNASDLAKGDSVYTWTKVLGSGNASFTPNGSGAAKDTVVAVDAPGRYRFKVTMSDSRGFTEVSKTVDVTVYNSDGTLPPNSIPTANPQTLACAPASSIPITLTGSDPESATLDFIVTLQPEHGTLTGTAPNLVYSADHTYTSGADSFTFLVTDSEGATASATVTINVSNSGSQIYAYEDFNYTPVNDQALGRLEGKNGGTGWAAAWQDSIQDSDGYGFVYDSQGALAGLYDGTYGGGQPNWNGIVDNLPGSGNYVGLSTWSNEAVNQTTINAYRRLASNAGAMAAANGGVLWASMVVHQATSAFGVGPGLMLTTTDSYLRERGRWLSGSGNGIGVAIGANSQATDLNPAFMFNDGSQNVTAGNYLSNSKDNVIVLKFQFGPTQDTVSAWSFTEDLVMTEFDFNANASSAVSSIDESTLDTLTYAMGRKENAIDEIRLGNSFAAVTGVGLTAYDITPPTPDPITWDSVPAAAGSTRISMTATTVTDASGVEYYFDCVSGAGHDSGWQDSPTYLDAGLTPGASYTYIVRARDKSVNQNATGFSAPASATTGAIVPGAIDWGTATDNTGFTDVVTTGTLVSSCNGLAGVSRTVNGVVFDGVVAPSFTNSGILHSSRGPDTPLNDPNGEYKNFLLAQDWNGTNGMMLTGLEAGAQYLVQLWYVDTNGTDLTNDRVMRFDDNIGNYVDVDDFGSNNNGQYVIGSFVASSASQRINVNGRRQYTTGTVARAINGYQLRKIGNAPDSTPPALASTDIMDDTVDGTRIVGNSVVYTVTFSEAMDASTVNASDFANIGSAPATVGTILQASPSSFLVRLTPSTTGTLRLQVNAGAVLEDLAGNALDTSAAILDDTTISVVPLNTAPVWADNPVNESPASEDNSYSATLADDASDANANLLAFAKLSGPAWLNVASDGSLSGTPSNSDVGPNSFTVSVSDGIAAPVEATLNITVTNTNDAPVFAANPINGPDATEDSAYSATLLGSASDADAGASLSYAKVSGPAWLNIATDGALSGTPSNNEVGPNSFTVSVSDGIAAPVEATLNITVTNTNDTPSWTINPIAGSDTIAGDAYTGTLAGAATDADSGTTLAYAKVGGPAWLSVAADGALSGTPAGSDLGANAFTVSVSDGIASPVEATVNILVLADPDSNAVVHESFNMAAGALKDQPAGLGLSGNWQRHSGSDTNQMIVSSPGMSYGSLPVSANRVKNGSTGGGRANHALTDSSLVNAGLLSDGATLWFGVLVQPVVALNSTSGIALASGNITSYDTAGINGIGINVQNGSDLEYCAWKSGTTGTYLRANAQTDLHNIGGTGQGYRPHLVVGKVVWGTGGANDTFEIYMPDANLVQGARKGAVQSINIDQSTFNRIVVYNGAAGIEYDEIRVGSTYESVIGQLDGNFSPVWAANPITGTNATEDAPYAATLAGAVTDADAGDTLTFAKVGGPVWLNIAADGTLTGTPTNNDVGSNSFTVSVSDGTAAPVEATLDITVFYTNDAPVFTVSPINGSDATEDIGYTGSIAGSASDADAGATLSYAKAGGPAWLNVASDGSLSGTPGNGDVGPNSFTVSVSDGIAAPVEATLDIAVLNTNDAPAWVANPVNAPDATEDAPYGASLVTAASDEDAGAVLTFAKLGGPAWLVIASDGTLTGTPGNGDVGPNSFTVSVSDGIAAPVEAVLNITVFNTNDVPFWTGNPVNEADASEDAAYSGSIASSAMDADAGASLTFAKVSGPAWLTVASNGALSGTPTYSDVGANSFTVSVSDGIASPVEATLQITVDNTNDAPVFTTDPIVAAGAQEGIAYTGQTLAGSATDADAGDTITYSKVSGPAWLSVAADGALTGTPGNGTAGLNTFVVRATDSASATDEVTLEITVAGLPLPWTSVDIGTGMLAGSATYAAGTFTQAGSGVIGSTSDKFRFTYQTLTGDGEIIARISGLQDTGTSSRVGVMIRNSLAANSMQVFMGLTGSSSYRWTRRTVTGGNTSTTNSSTGTVPNTWVRLVRSGNIMTAYKSTNGTTWTTVGSTTNATIFSSTCYIGLAIGSGSDTTINTSQFGNVSVTP